MPNASTPNLPAGPWPFEQVPVPADVGFHCSLALNERGDARVSCWRDPESLDPKLLLLRQEGGQWQTPQVLASVRGARSSLALDAAGRAIVAYWDLDAGAVMLVSPGATPEPMASGVVNFSAGALSLALAPGGAPHVAFAGGSGVQLAARGAAPEVASGATAVTDCALGFDTQGTPHIAYFDLDRQSLMYVRRIGGVWQQPLTVDGPSVGFAGEFVSLAVDSTGVAHVSYQALDGLKYAKLVGQAPWTIETVEAGARVGLYNSLRLDGAGRPAVSYYNSASGDLRFARRRDQWTAVTVASNGDVGGFASLAIDEFNSAHVAFYDWDARQLRLAHSNRPPTLPGLQLSTFVNRSVSGNTKLNAVDPEGDELVPTTTPVVAPSNGTLVIQPSGAFTYTPREGFNGVDRFRYEVCDAGGSCSRADATVTVVIPVLVSASPEPFAETTRTSRVTLRVQSSAAALVEVVMEKRSAATGQFEVFQHGTLAGFLVTLQVSDFSTGPFRLIFRVPSRNYVLARSEEFFIPKAGSQLDAILTGSLVESEGPLHGAGG